MRKKNSRCAVIYHTKDGDCEMIAVVIAAGLQEAGFEPTFADVRSVADLECTLKAVFLGSPTCNFHATWPMFKFIKRLVNAQHRGMYFASFGTGVDTEIEQGRRQSSDEIHEHMCRKGLVPLAPPFKAAAYGTMGPLVPGELDRAFRHGVELGMALDTKDRGDGGAELRDAI